MEQNTICSTKVVREFGLKINIELMGLWFQWGGCHSRPADCKHTIIQGVPELVTDISGIGSEHQIW